MRRDLSTIRSPNSVNRVLRFVNRVRFKRKKSAEAKASAVLHVKLIYRMPHPASTSSSASRPKFSALNTARYRPVFAPGALE